jgi:hypothetical protein
VFCREAYRLLGKKGLYGGTVQPYKAYPDQPHRLIEDGLARGQEGGGRPRSLARLEAFLFEQGCSRWRGRSDGQGFGRVDVSQDAGGSQPRGNEAKRMAVSVFNQVLPNSTTQ